ncbi:MAG TPA: hypothetical protein VJN67_17530 [Stellaceae bacterium]|nr:hypothetical protein [Stellaceae bacterium]
MTMKRSLAALAALTLALAAIAITVTVGARPALAQVTCPTILPPATNFTAATTTQGQFKTNLTSLVAYLTCLLGTDGTTATAKTTLGLATVATSGNYTDLSSKPTSLPPSGAAGGDLTGTYPNPTLAPGGGSLAALLQGHIGGLTLSNDGTSPQTVIDTSSGVATSDDASTMMKLASFTKSTAGWSVGGGNGCLDSGTVANSTWYHLFVIERTDTGVVDELCSTSATAPTLPASYTKKRRIGSFKTDASGHILAFTQTGTGSKRKYLWGTAVNDISSQIVNSGARTLFTMTSVPLGIKVDGIFDLNATNATAPTAGSFASPDTGDGAPSANWQVIVSNKTYSAEYIIRTDASQRVGFGSGNNSTNVTIETVGWYDDI